MPRDVSIERTHSGRKTKRRRKQHKYKKLIKIPFRHKRDNLEGGRLMMGPSLFICEEDPRWLQCQYRMGQCHAI